MIFLKACVKNSVHRWGGGGILACIEGGVQACLAGIGGVWYPRMPCRWYPSMPCMGGGGLQVHTWGVSRPTPWGGGCVSQHALRQTPPWTATAAGGTYPTGIHSCSFVNPALFALSLLLFPQVLKMNFCCFRLRYGIFQTESVNKVLMHTTGSSEEYALILVENISFR